MEIKFSKQAVKFIEKQDKKMVLAWDPDYTKLTETEYKELKEAEEQIKNGELIDYKDIKW